MIGIMAMLTGRFSSAVGTESEASKISRPVNGLVYSVWPVYLWLEPVVFENTPVAPEGVSWIYVGSSPVILRMASPWAMPTHPWWEYGRPETGSLAFSWRGCRRNLPPERRQAGWGWAGAESLPASCGVLLFLFGSLVCGWLEVDDIRSDGRAGAAVAFGVFGVRRCWNVVTAKGPGSPVSLQVAGFPVLPGSAADDAGS